MIESHDALVDIINGFNDVLDENQHKDGETSYEEIFDDDKIGICKQPFGSFFQLQLEKVEVSNAGEEDNLYYKPEFFAAIVSNWLYMAPFWTALLLGMIYKCNYNYIIKNLFNRRPCSPPRGIQRKWLHASMFFTHSHASTCHVEMFLTSALYIYNLYRYNIYIYINAVC